MLIALSRGCRLERPYPEAQVHSPASDARGIKPLIGALEQIFCNPFKRSRVTRAFSELLAFLMPSCLSLVPVNRSFVPLLRDLQ